jgi:S-formylglutathione hydrolase FrmB
MSYGTFHFHSAALKRHQQFNFILPDPSRAGPGPYPCFYLVHGASDDYSAWMTNTGIWRYVRDLPLVVVMPDVERSFCVNTHFGQAFEEYLVTDLIGWVEHAFPVRPGRGNRVVGGLSMGGYGAMLLGLKHPEMFCSVGSHSSAFSATAMPEWSEAFGPPGCQTRQENDLFRLAEGIDRAQLPALYVDCGVNDFLIDQNRSFHAHLEKLEIPHVYHEYPGAHDWTYWDLHVQESLAHHCRALRIGPAANEDAEE